MENSLIQFASFPASIMSDSNIAGTINGIDMSGTIVRLISFLLGICGATYLAAGLWSRSQKGSNSWKYLSISMILFVFWNIIGAFGILLDVIKVQNSINDAAVSQEGLELFSYIVKVLDPLLEVIVFIILLFGLRKIINAMRTKPWTVFSKDEEEIE
ncbi:MAG: hypothetical protein MPEBLZ_00089 [Candidatus Methanoperedens nitroreducens]|uniref:Uncharacterized protein n=1 Tax=Candidatus Methanoperedens nitratireducens TaxID=1392998 RepID=A0A0P8AKI1_9EURY|nr:hypothetical protein [Candidatus Methanoperedens sp. BLZ2]KAB2944865.1 MAG: hypothetical protein F9K14_12550 [Candidatus Methanoperedens sp.]KPQ45319.1 MAG: hypothetical protein MPEBLZ_00089 [Candidatus Methanoperedens sp. BLZ1]MBZ0173738.1 hypothetical protein [Candidatus Methanoperedens nitroreducens]CAG0984756.1 hypothetical protein METP2_02199 [Methanosarcinales archaeon]MCX9078239.1 hypothetical protein [Candidatus Methanoperedens sp.]